MKKLAVFAAVLAFSGCAGMQSKPDFNTLDKQAQNEIDKAAAMDHEWRDSQKFLNEAEKLHKAGMDDKAMRLATKAKQEGILAQKQAKAQEDAGPWLF